MITEDSNIDLFPSNKIQNRYIEVLETYGLNNHITKATPIGKKLIDHIISDIPALLCPTISDQTCLLTNSRQDTNT